MNKSSRTAIGSNRRYSQPVVPSSSSLALTSGRRGSEMVGAIKGGGGGDGGLHPPPHLAASSSSSSASSAQFDEKMMVVEAKGPRKVRGKDGDGPIFDADQYNPDGSLRTIHCMPDFHTAYAEAQKARYIRYPKKSTPDMEKEVPIHRIFRD